MSGFQHDAVENIVSRLSVNALPAVKFGHRSGGSEFTEDTVKKKIKYFCEETAKGIRAKNPRIIQTEDQRRLSELLNLYALSPSLRNAIHLLNRILMVPRNLLTQELADKTSQLIETLNSEANSNQFTRTASLRLIRALRISEEGFRDDGKEKTADVLESFETVLDESERKALKKAITWESGRHIDFLNDLRSIKLKLLDMYTPKPLFRIEKPREDILELIAQVSRRLDKHRARANQTDVILADFLHELEDNPGGVRETMEDYNFVFAATTQYAGSMKMSNVKTKYSKDASVKYDTVVVDEAARTSPRDLLIPMSQAEKRIILVGDHRQLPHMIDEEVAKALETDEGSENPNLNQDFVKKSMFEYLFNRLKKLEQKDNICRIVTLDAQYRMHPLLGEFISNNFYYKPDGDEPYDERFKSPLPADLFAHKLRDTEGCAATWLKVSNKDGKEEQLPNKSRRRIAEAQAIADRLTKWIDSDEGKKLSFGVISFYKAQVYAVFEELSKHGITERYSGGAWGISDEYKFLKKEEDGKSTIEERFRIGTVDAFQGMEFDVVFLSIVRSQDMNNLPGYINNENNYKKKQHKMFGHLMSENRLCVSMSRQMKMLILVGDSDLVQTDIGKEAVPALGNYFELCSMEGVIL